MSRDHGTTKEELSSTLAKLRWSLTSLRWGGVEDWPSRAASDASGANEAAGGKSMAREPGRPEDPQKTLEKVQLELGDCTRCRLHGTRNKLVFGEGSPQARIVFVGEGPGYDEDRQGRPFVGKAGKLLDKMIKAMGFVREQVYICNMVKCRPPNNRTPKDDEIEVCSPFLVKQIEAIGPQVICALGACAAQSLLGSTSPISRLRSSVHQWRGIPLVATYHPAYLLRNPSQKAPAWQDLLKIISILED